MDPTMPADAETERTVVKTYVPQYQKEQWLTDADRLDMNQSEFLRTMVQAGRSKLLEGNAQSDSESTDEESGSPAVNPGGDGLETRLRDVLTTEDYRQWDELVDLVIQDFEEELEDVLNSLRDSGAVEHSPRQNGYILTGGESNG